MAGRGGNVRRSGLPAWLAPAAIAVITVAVFLPVLRADFVAYDDPENFLQNLRYRGLGWTQLRWMWSTTHLGHYVPLSWMTLGLDYLLWGMNPAGYHAVNLLLHATNGVLLYAVARRVFRLAGIPNADDGWRALIPPTFAALMFAIHPLRVESVAWITERRDMLSLLFSLASVVFFLNAQRDATRHGRWYALSIAMYVCALLSKATAVTLPAVLLILTVYPLRRLGGRAGWTGDVVRRALMDLVPFIVAGAAAGLASIIVLQPGPQLPWSEKVAASAYSFAFYLWKTVVPVGLAPLYERRSPLPTLSAAFIASYFTTLACVAIAWLLRRRFPGVTAALAAFSVALLPLLGIIQNGPQIAADRYTYHAAPALALLFGAAFATSLGRAPMRVAGAFVLLTLGFQAFNQTHVWRNSESLWLRVLQFDGASYLANNNLGVVLAEKGRSDEAIEHYRRALRTRPAYADAHNNLGYEFAQRGDLSGAVEHYEKALQADPGFADAEVNWGNALFVKGRLDSAVVHYARAASLDPERAGVHFNWGLALAQSGDLREAIAHYRRALELDPGLPDARDALADAMAELAQRR